MSFQINQGLFKFDFNDCHAILGIPVDADPKEIRKRYLKIARRLHSDSSAFADADKQRAEEFLSKLVNPAWEKLQQEKERTEYNLLLKLKGQYAVQQQTSLELNSAVAKQLYREANVDAAYRNSINELAEKQYESLDAILEITGQISELNLVYLMRREGSNQNTVVSNRPQVFTSAAAAAGVATPSAAASPPPPPAPPPKESFVDQYYKRAEAYIEKNNLAASILELRDALKIEPNNPRCHSLMGRVYLMQKLPKAAKVHVKRALELAPDDEMAQQSRKILERMGEKLDMAAAKSGQSASDSKGKAASQSKGGGFFGLFGGKK